MNEMLHIAELKNKWYVCDISGIWQKTYRFYVTYSINVYKRQNVKNIISITCKQVKPGLSTIHKCSSNIKSTAYLALKWSNYTTLLDKELWGFPLTNVKVGGNGFLPRNQSPDKQMWDFQILHPLLPYDTLMC